MCKANLMAPEDRNRLIEFYFWYIVLCKVMCSEHTSSFFSCDKFNSALPEVVEFGSSIKGNWTNVYRISITRLAFLGSAS